MTMTNPQVTQTGTTEGTTEGTTWRTTEVTTGVTAINYCLYPLLSMPLTHLSFFWDSIIFPLHYHVFGAASIVFRNCTPREKLDKGLPPHYRNS